MSFWDDLQYKQHNEILERTKCAIAEVKKGNKHLTVAVCALCLMTDEGEPYHVDDNDMITLEKSIRSAFYDGSDDKLEIESINEVNHSDIAKRTGISEDNFGLKALERDFWVKILKAEDIMDKVKFDARRAEDEADEDVELYESIYKESLK